MKSAAWLHDKLMEGLDPLAGAVEQPPPSLGGPLSSDNVHPNSEGHWAFWPAPLAVPPGLPLEREPTPSELTLDDQSSFRRHLMAQPLNPEAIPFVPILFRREEREDSPVEIPQNEPKAPFSVLQSVPSGDPAFSRVLRATAPQLPVEWEENLGRWCPLRSELTVQQAWSILSMLETQCRAFSKDEHDLGRLTAGKYRVESGGLIPPPWPVKPWGTHGLPPLHLSGKQMDGVQQIITTLLHSGLIRPSESPWAIRASLGVDRSKWGLNMSFKYLERLGNPDAISPVPAAPEGTLDRIRRANIFSRLPLTHGSLQIPLTEESCEKCAFTTPVGRWEWLVAHPSLWRASHALYAALQPVVEGVQHMSLIHHE